MEFGFRQAREQALFCDPVRLRRKYGSDCARKIERRIAQMRASSSLEMLCRLPQARCHQMVADRAEQFSLDLEHPLRMIVEVADDPVPRRKDGGIDRVRVSRLAFVEIIDTH